MHWYPSHFLNMGCPLHIKITKSYSLVKGNRTIVLYILHTHNLNAIAAVSLRQTVVSQDQEFTTIHLLNAYTILNNTCSSMCYSCIHCKNQMFLIKDGATLAIFFFFFFFVVFCENSFCCNLKTIKVKRIKVYIFRKEISQGSYLSCQIFG